MNAPAALEALAAVRRGDRQSAERILVAAHSPDAVTQNLFWLESLRCFRKRCRLAKLAAIDYREGRYHACIPLILALIDGMGQELNGAGLLRESARFEDPGSVLDIGKGIQSLVKILRAGRRSTTTEAIALPYRNGILHGIDLGYDNEVVAAKTWAALFAVACWAGAVEREDKPPVRRTLSESIKSLMKNRSLADEFEKWVPRHPADRMRVVNGEPADAGSPEGAMTELLRHWQARNFGLLADSIATSIEQSRGRLAGNLANSVAAPPVHFEFVSIEDFNAAATNVSVRLTAVDGSISEFSARLMYHVDGDWAPRTIPGGRWLCANYGFLFANEVADSNDAV